jgi:hypothetical protein
MLAGNYLTKRWISAAGRFPKFENLEQMAATPSKAIVADSLSMRRLYGEIEPEPKSAGRLPRRQIAPGSPNAALCRWLAVKLYVGEDVWYEAREFDPRQGAGQRSALRRPRIKWRDAGRQGAAFDSANVLVCVLSPVSSV